MLVFADDQIGGQGYYTINWLVGKYYCRFNLSVRLITSQHSDLQCYQTINHRRGGDAGHVGRTTFGTFQSQNQLTKTSWAQVYANPESEKPIVYIIVPQSENTHCVLWLMDSDRPIRRPLSRKQRHRVFGFFCKKRYNVRAHFRRSPFGRSTLFFSALTLA